MLRRFFLLVFHEKKNAFDFLHSLDGVLGAWLFFHILWFSRLHRHVFFSGLFVLISAISSQVMTRNHQYAFCMLCEISINTFQTHSNFNGCAVLCRKILSLFCFLFFFEIFFSFPRATWLTMINSQSKVSFGLPPLPTATISCYWTSQPIVSNRSILLVIFVSFYFNLKMLFFFWFFHRIHCTYIRQSSKCISAFNPNLWWWLIGNVLKIMTDFILIVIFQTSTVVYFITLWIFDIFNVRILTYDINWITYYYTLNTRCSNMQ